MTTLSQEGKSCPSTDIVMVEDGGYLVPNDVLGTGQTKPVQSNSGTASGLEASDMKVNETQR